MVTTSSGRKDLPRLLDARELVLRAGAIKAELGIDALAGGVETEPRAVEELAHGELFAAFEILMR
ncbi:MAG: hypothetical protein QM796_12820 [Chthoniobacteraceae bacterium]